VTPLPRRGAAETREEAAPAGSGAPDRGCAATGSREVEASEAASIGAPTRHPRSPGSSAPSTPSEPAPSTRRSRRTLLWTSSAYFGEGLPWSVLHQMATEYLTAIGASKTQTSSTSLLHLAVTFKFAWSPLVDLFGTRRRWLLLTQVLLGLGMLLAGAVVGSGSLLAFWCVLGVISVVHATHDVACDGFYLQVLDPRSQALFSGTRAAAYRVALLVGSAFLVYLAGRTSWPLAFCTAGGLMLLVSVLNASVLPRGEARAPSARSRSAKFLTAYRSFFEQPQAVTVLTFMFFYRLGDIMMFAMSKPLLRDIGIETAERGILNGVGTLASIAGSIAGGALIARRGLERCLVPLTYVQNLAIPLYVALAVFRPTFAGVLPLVVLEQLAAGLGAAASAVFLMQRTQREFSASHFAFATAVVSLASTLSGFLAGPLDEALGHVAFFTLAFVASWPSLLLVLFVPRRPVRSA
jgi:MFS transporter, PAT family, beta-lactamase induction signal transducer AmpG